MEQETEKVTLLILQFLKMVELTLIMIMIMAISEPKVTLTLSLIQEKAVIMQLI